MAASTAVTARAFAAASQRAFSRRDSSGCVFRAQISAFRAIRAHRVRELVDKLGLPLGVPPSKGRARALYLHQQRQQAPLSGPTLHFCRAGSLFFFYRASGKPWSIPRYAPRSSDRGLVREGAVMPKNRQQQPHRAAHPQRI